MHYILKQTIKMKKYKVIKPFSLLERILLVETDEIYAEKVRQMYHIYSPKTRKRIGTLSETLFNQYVKEVNETEPTS